MRRSPFAGTIIGALVLVVIGVAGWLLADAHKPSLENALTQTWLLKPGAYVLIRIGSALMVLLGAALLVAYAVRRGSPESQERDRRQAPGWYPDPLDHTRLRHWDGARWTDDLATPTQAISPPTPSGNKVQPAPPPRREVEPPEAGQRKTQSEADAHAPHKARRRPSLPAIGTIVLILVGAAIGAGFALGRGTGFSPSYLSRSDVSKLNAAQFAIMLPPSVPQGWVVPPTITGSYTTGEPDGSWNADFTNSATAPDHAHVVGGNIAGTAPSSLPSCNATLVACDVFQADGVPINHAEGASGDEYFWKKCGTGFMLQWREPNVTQPQVQALINSFRLLDGQPCAQR